MAEEIHFESPDTVGPLTPEQNRSIGRQLRDYFEGLLSAEYLEKLIPFYARHKGPVPDEKDH